MKKTEKDYVKMRAAAAKWIYERQQYAQWWRWGVITERNADESSPNLPETVAFNIFTDLVQRGLLIPTVGSDGHEAFKLNLGDQDGWKQVISPPSWTLIWVWKPAGYALRGWLWLLSVAIATAITIYVTEMLK